jgi:hypothetical protein
VLRLKANNKPSSDEPLPSALITPMSWMAWLNRVFAIDLEKRNFKGPLGVEGEVSNGRRAKLGLLNAALSRAGVGVGTAEERTAYNTGAGGWTPRLTRVRLPYGSRLQVSLRLKLRQYRRRLHAAAHVHPGPNAQGTAQSPLGR